MKINNLSIFSYYYSYLGLKKTKYVRYFLSMFEFNFKLSQNNLTKFYLYFFPQMFNLTDWHTTEQITTNLLIKDIINLNTIWRLIKGYPTKGQRTHSNAKKIKKNKLLHTFRLNQFFTKYGYRKRNIYPTLIIAEYTNKLWFKNWFSEWVEAYYFSIKLVKSNIKQVPFDPVKLAKNFTNGYVRVGKASKIGKSKKVTKIATIGFPVFFSRWLYEEFPPRTYPYKLWISDADRRKMGVKRKKNKKK